MIASQTAASIVSELIVSEEKSVDVSERTSEAISHEIHCDKIIEVGQEETGNTFDFITPTTVEIVNVDEVKPNIDVKKVIVSPENLEVYVGKARFSQDTIYDSAGTSLPPGVVMGLAWNPLVSHICLYFTPFRICSICHIFYILNLPLYYLIIFQFRLFF